jgi:nitronate monooxygenase
MFQTVLEALRYPIWQAPTGSIAGPELAAAVSKAGGMGAMGLTWTMPEVAAEQVNQVRKLTENPFFVNFALAFPPLALDATLEAGAPIVTFSWGDPEPYLPKVRAAGAKVGIQVTNVAGAQRAIAQGADFLVCQGIEAGGHVQSTRSLWELLPRMVEAASGVPVIAAGGIAQGKEIAKVLSLGAKGAILGTRFVATQESRAHPDYKRLLVEAIGETTALTICFEGGWPYSASRVLRNSTLEAWEAAGSPPIGSRPGEGETVAATANGEAILRYTAAFPQQGFTGNIEAMCLYAGTGCSAIADIPSAGELVERLWRDCGKEVFEDGGIGRSGGE